MKKIAFIILVTGVLIVLILSAITLFNQENRVDLNNTFPHAGFLANKGEISLLIISKDILGEEFKETLRQQGVKADNIRPILVYNSLEQVQNNYPELEVKKEPTFILFDSSSLIFSTSDEQRLIKFLKDKIK